MPSASALPFSLSSALLLPLSRLHPLYLAHRRFFIQLRRYLLSTFISVLPPALAPPLRCQPSPSLSLPAVPHFCLGPGPSFMPLPAPLPSVLAPSLSLVLPLLSAPPLPQSHPFSLGAYSLDTSPSPDWFFLFTLPPFSSASPLPSAWPCFTPFPIPQHFSLGGSLQSLLPAATASAHLESLGLHSLLPTLIPISLEFLPYSEIKEPTTTPMFFRDSLAFFFFFQVFSMSCFYPYFSLSRRGERIVTLCSSLGPG